MQWLYYAIPSALAVAALVTIIVIYVRQLPKVSALDLEAMPKHRQLVRKTSLVEDRLTRKLASARSVIRGVVLPLTQVLRQLFRKLLQRLRALEQRYQAAAHKRIAQSPSVEKLQSALTLVQAGNALVESAKYGEAEKKYIAAVAVDAGAVDAYRGLVRVYSEQKDWEHALATAQFLCQLDPKDEGVWYDLGTLYRDQKKYEEAMDAFDKALALGPNNPKNLDVYIEISILNQLKYKAQSTLDKLRTVNPDNKKLQKYQEQIDQL